MKVAILGDGPAGAAIYRLLKSRTNLDIDIFGKKSLNKCGMESCSWGVNRPKFENICEELDIPAQKYYTNIFNFYKLGPFHVKCNIAMIDKKLLLLDLYDRKVRYEVPNLDKYDRIIDATGVILGRHYKITQVKARLDTPLTVQISPSSCRWTFPLQKGESHIGSMSFNGSFPEVDIKKSTVICRCSSRIHNQGLVKPIVDGKIWKTGKSAGVTDPITGSGIVASMYSSLFLFENWNNKEFYEKKMRTQFGHTNSRISSLFRNSYRGLPIRLPSWSFSA